MESIGIDASPNQLRKLKKGMRVRIKKGTGFNLIVHPKTYNQMSHTFARNKGIDIALSPEELNANQNASMEGGSIFGKKFDRKHKDLMKVLNPIGKVLKPVAQDLLKQGGQMANAYGVPVQVTDPLVELGTDYMDDPSALQGKRGRRELKNRGLDFLQSGIDEFGEQFGVRGPNMREMEKHIQSARRGEHRQARRGMKNMGMDMLQQGADRMASQYGYTAPRVKDMERYVQDYRHNVGGPRSAPDMSMIKKMAKAEANKYLNEQLGTNYDYMNRAGLEQAGSNALRSMLDQQVLALKQNAPPMGEEIGYGLGGRVLKGYGLGGRLRMKEVSSIGRGAGMVGNGEYIPPALRSQPFGANFQMQHFLPPQYQQYWNPELDYMAGSGLYV